MDVKRFLGSILALAAASGLARADQPGPVASAPAVSAESRLAALCTAPQVAAPHAAPECGPCPPCPVDCCPRDSCCFNQGRLWGSAEFLLWWVSPGRVPPLGTASASAPGVLGAPGTTVLFGDRLNYGALPGARFTVGYWCDDDCRKGIEASYFFLCNGSSRSEASSSGAPGSVFIGRPFFNVITGLPDVQIVSFPGSIGGNLSVDSNTRLQGAEANLLCVVCCQSNPCPTDCEPVSRSRVSLIGGFRYLDLDEDLTITERLTVLPSAPAPLIPGSTFTVTDRFETRNQFYGGQVGARGEWWRGAWYAGLFAKVALGVTHQEIRATGTTDFTLPGGAVITQPGGLLVQASNAGVRERDRFSVIPEVGFNVGRQLTERIRVFAGYSFLYWSSVVRPGDQIDPGVNLSQLPTPAGPGVLVGPARPAPLFRESSLWAHGLNAGVAFNW
jgi:putative beta barrel porin BBP7